MNRSDWTLLAISAAGGKPLQPVQLQKILFLLEKNASKALGGVTYDFVPYDYGPFSPQAYQDARGLAEQSLVSAVQKPGGWSEYAATPQGLARANRLRETVPEDAVEYLQAVVDWARGLTFTQLVRAIYQEYPEYRENSVFRG